MEKTETSDAQYVAHASIWTKLEQDIDVEADDDLCSK
jgi:hypothetical protein